MRSSEAFIKLATIHLMLNRLEPTGADRSSATARRPDRLRPGCQAVVITAIVPDGPALVRSG